MLITDFLKNQKKLSLKELEKFCKEYLKDDPLWKNANNLVFGEGKENAEVFFIGEAPGENEDLQGKPFVGRAGKLLRETLEEFGIKNYYITNLLKIRPPNNRNPKKEEIERHKLCLIKQLTIVNPKIIVPLGNFASRFVLNKFNTKGMEKIPSISQTNGKVYKIEFANKKFKVIPIYHPAAVLYNPKLREEFKRAFKTLKEEIEKNR